MEKELISNPTREDFVGWMTKRLEEFAFEKDMEREFWFNERDLQGPTQTIIINNQRKDMPGETHHVRFEVEVFGDGEMKDVDTEVVNPFIEVNFNVFQDGQDMSDWPTFCIFFDDQILFDSLLNKIFGL